VLPLLDHCLTTTAAKPSDVPSHRQRPAAEGAALLSGGTGGP
jgi:hypothetical protein